MTIPLGRTHWPVILADYKEDDKKAGYGDAHYIDIGQATWDKEDFSAKIWRWASTGQRWSRQSEELPLTRVLDLAILAAAVITKKESVLNETCLNKDQIEALHAFVTDNMAVLGPRLVELRRILYSSENETLTGSAPNIFSFATSELSQDAIFAWLLLWASPNSISKDLEIHRLALEFVKLLTGEKVSVASIDVGRQWEHIDVWAEINEDAILIIEDKTGTTIHDNQLQRYKEIVNNTYPTRKKYFAYVKTGNEPKSILDKVERDGYRIVLRKDILDCLEHYNGNNAIIVDYRAYLREKEKDMQNFRVLPIKEWTWGCWEGFYKELEYRNVIDNWSYVPNRSGGFLGAFWHFTTFANGQGQIYLQFEQDRLCFKICPDCDKSDRSIIRNKCCEIIMRLAKDRFPEICRPDHFGSGEYMTIARVDSKMLWGDSVVDIDKVVNRICHYERLVDECAKQL